MLLNCLIYHLLIPITTDSKIFFSGSLWYDYFGNQPPALEYFYNLLCKWIILVGSVHQKSSESLVNDSMMNFLLKSQCISKHAYEDAQRSLKSIMPRFQIVICSVGGPRKFSSSCSRVFVGTLALHVFQVYVYQ